MSNQLKKYYKQHLLHQQDNVLKAFAIAINNRLNDSVIGIIFYGSCMRSSDYKDAMLDFYVIVDEYTNAYKSIWYRLANYLLPPNVFYIEVEIDENIYRAKYAVMTSYAMEKVTKRSFHSYFWARFIQPVSYIYAKNVDFVSWLVAIQCASAKSFYRAVQSGFNTEVDSQTFWREGLTLTYKAEIRTESNQRAMHLYEDNREFYDELFSQLNNSEICFKKTNKLNPIQWKIRILYGKLLSVLRLMKATTTFVGGVDYIAWKIERHTGEAVEVSAKMRKHPWLYSWPVIFRLYKQGKFR